MVNERFSGMVAVVTGAGSGIGRAAAMRLAAEGASVGILDLDDESAKSVASEIEDHGGRAVAHALDVRDSSAVQATVDAVVSEFNGLHVAVNAAGVWNARALDDLEESEWDRFVGIHMTGPMLVAKHSLPHLRRVDGGNIVNVGSAGSLVGSKAAPHYGAVKGGLHLFGKSLALQLASEGIRVNTVCPGPTETALYEDIGGIDKVRSRMEAAVPLGRLGKPEEIAAAIAFVASPEASFITGSALVVDGGYLAQ